MSHRIYSSFSGAETALLAPSALGSFVRPERSPLALGAFR